MDYTNPNEVKKYCSKRASRFKSKAHHDDLVSEGILAIYEMVHKGKTDRRTLEQAAKRAMHDYLNIKTNVLSIPVTPETRKASRNPNKLVMGVFDSDVQRALGYTSEPLDENMGNTPSGVDIETSMSLVSVINKSLSGQNNLMFKSFHYGEFTQEEIAQVTDNTQVFVSRVLSDSLEKVGNYLILSLRP